MNGVLDSNTAATLALLADTSRAGNRGGFFSGGGEGGYGVGMMYPGNSVLAAGAHADGTAIKTAIDCNAGQFTAGLTRVSDQAEESRRISAFGNIGDQLFRSELRNTDRMGAITDGQFRTEIRTNDRLRDIELNSLRDRSDTNKAIADCCCSTQAAIAAAAKEAALCCCNAQLEACKSQSELKALVIAENSATRELIRGDALSAANARIIQLETINALSNNHHGHR